MESSVRTSGAKPTFATAKKPQELFFGFFGFRAGLTGTGLPNSTAARPAGMITLASGPPIVTVKEHVERLPATSVATQATVVTPAGKLEPAGGEHATTTPGRLSLIVGGG